MLDAKILKPSSNETAVAYNVGATVDPWRVPAHADNAFQMEVNAIAYEMERRATSFYGLGYGIGKHILGTIKDDEYLDSEYSDDEYSDDEQCLIEKSNDTKNSNIFQKATNWISSFFFSPSSTLSSSPSSVEQEKSDDQGFCIEQTDSMLPQAVLLRAADLDVKKEAYFSIPIMSFTDDEKALIFHNAYTTLHKKLFNVEKNFLLNTVNGIESPHQICENLAKINENGPIKLFTLNGHGSPTTVVLGKGEEGKINLKNYFWSSASKEKALSCLDTYLDDDAIIILESCSTAAKHRYMFEDSLDVVPINMQTFIAAQAPGRTVFAPDYDVSQFSVEVSFGPTMTVGGRGFAEREIVKNKCQKLNLKEALGSGVLGYCAEAACEIYNIHLTTLDYYKKISFHFIGNETVPLKPFKVISPQHAPFCKEVLAYYSAKKYCDHANIKPSKRKIQECENDKKCKELKTKLAK